MSKRDETGLHLYCTSSRKFHTQDHFFTIESIIYKDYQSQRIKNLIVGKSKLFFYF